MSGFELDKSTVANISSLVIVLGAIAYFLIYPNAEFPKLFENMIMLIMGYLFTVTGVTLGMRMLQREKSQ